MFPDAQQERLKLGSLFVRHEQPPHFAELKPSYRIGRQRGHTFVVCATLSQARKTVKVSAESGAASLSSKSSRNNTQEPAALPANKRTRRGGVAASKLHAASKRAQQGSQPPTPI